MKNIICQYFQFRLGRQAGTKKQEGNKRIFHRIIFTAVNIRQYSLNIHLECTFFGNRRQIFPAAHFKLAGQSCLQKHGIYPWVSTREWLICKPELSRRLQNHQLVAVISTEPAGSL
jgi:hypothetical protein